MAIEDKVKTVLGEQAFHIVVLSHQIEEMQKRIVELEQQHPLPVQQTSVHTNGSDASVAHELVK